MTDAGAQAASNGQPSAEQAALGSDAAATAASPDLSAVPVAALPPVADERPELGVGAAFAGGLVLALVLKRLAR
jgi:hypothetical protein